MIFINLYPGFKREIMGNGGPECKAAADYVTTDVNDNGLENAFRHLGLIK
jgi:Predicted hydrolases of the HAD superfamily